MGTRVWGTQVFHRELKYHEKLEFPKLEYLKSSRFLRISKTVINWYFKNSDKLIYVLVILDYFGS